MQNNANNVVPGMPPANPFVTPPTSPRTLICPDAPARPKKVRKVFHGPVTYEEWQSGQRMLAILQREQREEEKEREELAAAVEEVAALVDAFNVDV